MPCGIFRDFNYFKKCESKKNKSVRRKKPHLIYLITQQVSIPIGNQKNNEYKGLVRLAANIYKSDSHRQNNNNVLPVSLTYT
jgi:hypothetical protein